MKTLSEILLVIAYGVVCLLAGGALNGKYGVEKQGVQYLKVERAK